ncbi:hypothetical protein Pfo_012184 [Paulownia fortunei]|nr:hypothetical protein Pfo_012184 [Paulownia fortunei]
MKGGKDEGKPMDPLFPRLHINDADKGGPRAPPRNKMALCEQYNAPSQSPMFNSGSMTMLPIRPSNGHSSFVPQASSSQVGGSQQKALPTFCSLPGSSHLDHSYYSAGVNLYTSLRDSEPRMSEPTNYQNQSVSGNSISTTECNALQPHDFNNCCMKRCGDENDYRTPSFGQLGMTQIHGNLQLHLDEEKLTTFSSVSSGKLHNAYLLQPKETSSGDQTGEHQRNDTDKDSNISQDTENRAEKPVFISSAGDKVSVNTASTPLAENNMSELDAKAFKSVNHHNKSNLADEPSRSCYPYAKPCQECRIPQEIRAITDVMSGMPKRIMTKRCASAMDDVLHSYPRLGNNNGPSKIKTIKECSEDKDCGSVQVANADKKQEISDTSVVDSIPVLDLTPDDVVGVIGQRLFWKARNTIVHQQRTFAMQIFELHRLIKVQRLIAGSREVLYENNFNLNKPSIKFPPTNKLLYATPLDPSPVVTKCKVDALKLNPGKDCKEEAVWVKLPPPVDNAEKGHLAQQSTPKASPTPASIPNDKIAPWCFHPPGNQWLVPIKSPSEGLIYKPYTGPCPSTVGIMAPGFGNYGPISLSTVGGTAYGVPAPDHQGIVRFSGTVIGQSCFQPYAMPLINPSCPNLELEQMIPFARSQSAVPNKHSSTFDANFAIPLQSCCNVASQSSRVVFACGGNMHGSRGSDMQESSAHSPAERLQVDALSLFPITPSLQVSKDQCNEQSVQVIKVVPHNPSQHRNQQPGFSSLYKKKEIEHDQ